MLRRVLRVFAVALVLIVIGAWSASALWITRTGAQGWTNVDSGWAWSSRKATNISIQVKDTACDGRAAYAYFKVDSDFDFTTSGRYNKKGCNSSETWTGLYIDAVTAPIYGVRFVVCTDGVGCSTSAYYDNPAN